MKIVAVSDMHGNLPDIPECDLLLIGGDIAPDYIRSFFRGLGQSVHKGAEEQRKWLDTVFRDWLKSVPATHIVGIAGNHDFGLEGREGEEFARSLPWSYLRDEMWVGTDYDNDEAPVRVWGTPWVPNLPFWAFHASPAALDAQADLIPHGIDILLSHGPPHGILDRCPQSVGDYSLNKAIRRVKPKHVVFGHIHEGHGSFGAENVEYHNVSVVDEFYDMVHRPTVIDL